MQGTIPCQSEKGKGDKSASYIKQPYSLTYDFIKEMVKLLHSHDEAFKDSAASLWLVGMPASHIICIAHMLCAKQVLGCLIPLPVPVEAQERPAHLNHQKATGQLQPDA